MCSSDLHKLVFLLGNRDFECICFVDLVHVFSMLLLSLTFTFDEFATESIIWVFSWGVQRGKESVLRSRSFSYCRRTKLSNFLGLVLGSRDRSRRPQDRSWDPRTSPKKLLNFVRLPYVYETYTRFIRSHRLPTNIASSSFRVF